MLEEYCTKHCFVYCGPEKCTCARQIPQEYADYFSVDYIEFVERLLKGEHLNDNFLKNAV